MNHFRVMVPVGLASLVLLTTACVEPRACTEIGATNGVSVTLRGVDRSEDLVVEVCVAGTCRTGPVFAGPVDPTFVDLPAVASTAPVDVTVTVRTQAGVVLVPATTVRTTPTTVQPNGPDCEPTAYQAAVTVGGP